MFFDLTFTKESQSDTSKCNNQEAKFIISLLSLLTKKMNASLPNDYNENVYDLDPPDTNLSEKIGIISPYKSQVRLIK